MNRLMMFTALMALSAAPALAHGEAKQAEGAPAKMAAAGHDNSDGHHGEMTVGKPGDAASVTRTVALSMDELDDGRMVFKPASLDVKQGETIRFTVTNDGEVDHEFVLDDHKGIQKHKAVMEKFPEMEHDDPNSVRLAPGEKGEVIWTFSNEGPFQFACMIPGHYDAGMKGDLMVGP